MIKPMIINAELGKQDELQRAIIDHKGRRLEINKTHRINVNPDWYALEIDIYKTLLFEYNPATRILSQVEQDSTTRALKSIKDWYIQGELNGRIF